MPASGTGTVDSCGPFGDGRRFLRRIHIGDPETATDRELGETMPLDERCEDLDGHLEEPCLNTWNRYGHGCRRVPSTAMRRHG